MNNKLFDLTLKKDKEDSNFEKNIYREQTKKRNFFDPNGLSDLEYKRLYNKFINEYTEKRESLLQKKENNLILNSGLNTVINKMNDFINDKLTLEQLDELFALNLFEIKYIYNKYFEKPKEIIDTVEKSFKQPTVKSFEYKKTVDDLTPLIRKYVKNNRLAYLKYELKKIMIKYKKFFKTYNITNLVDTWYDLLIMDIDLQYSTLKNKIDSYYKDNKVNYSNYIIYNTKVTINYWLKFNKQFIILENSELKNVIKRYKDLIKITKKSIKMLDAEKENRIDKYNFIINLFTTHIKKINNDEIKLAKYTKSVIVDAKKTLKKQSKSRRGFRFLSRKKKK